MERAEPVGTLRAAAARTRTSRLLDPLREWAATTPGRLALISLAVIASAVCFGVIVTGAERARARAAHAVRYQTEPLLVQAVTLYTALEDANATVTTTFLKGGLEPPALRARYLHEIRLASDALASLTREVSGSAQAHTALRTISEELPIYAGLVETARADNRQGLPIGAAYLRNASALLTGKPPPIPGTIPPDTGTILPSADRLYEIEASRLTQDYGSGTETVALLVLIIASAAALALLVLAQLYLARISRRTFNVGMLLATLVLVGVSIWAVLGLTGEQSALARARNDSDSLELLSAAQVLLSRAQSDQSLTLVNRGSDETDPPDLQAVTRALAPPGGLLMELAGVAQGAGQSAAARGLVLDFETYQGDNAQVKALMKDGELNQAITAASGAGKVAERMNANLSRQVAAAHLRFRRAAADATSSLSGLTLAIPLLTALTGALALIGLRARLREYT